MAENDPPLKKGNLVSAGSAGGTAAMKNPEKVCSQGFLFGVVNSLKIVR